LKNYTVLYIILFFATAAIGQNNYTVVKTNGINTVNDDLASCIFENQLLFITNGKQDLVNDYSWNKRNLFHIEKATRGATLETWSNCTPLFDHLSFNDEGPACFNSDDSVFYFSSANHYKGTKGHNIKIYMIRQTDNGWTEPVALPFCDNKYDYAHPWYDASQNLLVFSSNIPGGAGLMDICYSYKTPEGWSEPTNCGIMVNGVNNELFPSVYNGDIYYSSNSGGGLGGYDLKKALRSQQWKSSVLLEEPINSIEDDIAIIFLNDERALLTSNRSGGLGGDDVYLVKKNIEEEQKHNYSSQLFCASKPLNSANVIITNSIREVISEQQSDSLGNISIKELVLQQRYKFQLTNVPPSQFTDCVLHIIDEKGNKVREIRFNAFGFAELELLPLNYADLKLITLEDNSILTINIEGQIFEEKPGDVNTREPIMILDDQGEPVAIAYTNETGKFKFTEVEPKLNYTFKLSEESKVQNVLITNHGDKIVLPVLQAEVHYQRLNAEEAISLVNEYNEVIFVSAKDIFVINRIYYEYNSAQLTPEAKSQLEQLAIVLEKNKNINLELRSHTDSRGNDEYNLALSKKRAVSAVQYIAGKKINEQRLIPIGLGETMLLNECDDNAECSEPEHTLNRRTEIKIIKVQ
jgi:outer membrane protein OmpA-like peptidoglycan-associated protein